MVNKARRVIHSTSSANRHRPSWIRSAHTGPMPPTHQPLHQHGFVTSWPAQLRRLDEAAPRVHLHVWVQRLRGWRCEERHSRKRHEPGMCKCRHGMAFFVKVPHKSRARRESTRIRSQGAKPMATGTRPSASGANVGACTA